MATTSRSSSGADYTLKLGLDTSIMEKAQLRVERILKRTQKVEKLFNNERISAANKLLGIERRIADQRLRGTRPGIGRAARNAKSTSGSTGHQGMVPGQVALSADIDKLNQRLRSNDGIIDKDVIDSTKKNLDSLEGSLRKATDPKEVRRLRSEFGDLNRDIKAVAAPQTAVRPTSISGSTRTSGGARTGSTGPVASSRIVPELESLKTLDKIDELGNKIRAKGSILDPAQVASAQNKLKDLRSKIQQTSNPRQFARLKRQYSAINKDINQTVRNTERLNRSMSLQQFASKGLSQSMMNLGRAYFSVFAIIEGAKAFINITKRIETAEVALLNAAGTAVQAGKDFEFARRLANGLGLEMISTAEAFGKFGAAANLGGLSTEETREVFTDISSAIAGAALSADRANLVFQGFQQVMSKGVLSMEEVRQQIGESLPQGMAALSKATGKTGQDLFKFIESGKAISSEILPLWAKELAKLSSESGALGKSTQSLNAKWNRFLNATTDIVRLLGDVGVSGLMGTVLEIATEVLSIFGGILKVSKSIFVSLGFISDELDGVVSKTGEFGANVDSAGRRLTGVQKIMKTISGAWNNVVGNVKIFLAYMNTLITQMGKVGVIDAFGETSRIAKEAESTALRRLTAERHAKNFKGFTDPHATPVTVQMTNNITASDPVAVRQEVEKAAERIGRVAAKRAQQEAFKSAS